MKLSTHGVRICISSPRVRPRLQEGRFPSVNSAAAFPHPALGLPHFFTFEFAWPTNILFTCSGCFALRTSVANFF